MKWDKVLLNDGKFRDKRYAYLIAKALEKVKYMLTLSYNGNGTNIYNLFMNSIFTDRYSVSRHTWNKMSALTVYAETPNNYANYPYLEEVANIIPSKDLIVLDNLAWPCSDDQEYAEQLRNQITLVIHKNKLYSIRGSYARNIILLAAQNTKESDSKQQLSLDTLFEALEKIDKIPVVEMEDFHDKQNTTNR